ncbi:alcohol acetyltransferase [Aspergillus alliaceus]|uniref:Alcohol acetyltransferase n=1 Tax=Petromyces alliaceus TaxID=209559 RepID=A0A5N7CAF3_PETAA|nr:alcohol acetyltransferase [Aspergillus alliaceus]
MPLQSFTRLRAASKNERRYIMRHALGWYRSLVISGLYTLEKGTAFDATTVSSYLPALKWCIESHPILSAAIEGDSSETPMFIRPPELDLQNHIKILEPGFSYCKFHDALDLLKQATLEAHDQPWSNMGTIPQWKILILPLPNPLNIMQKRIYVMFVYSHTHGDGKSGLAFHRSFLHGLQTAEHKYDQNMICQPPISPLPPPLEDACNLRITWSYLLSPLLQQHLPRFLCRWFGVQSQPPAHAYTGQPITYIPERFRTGSQTLIIQKNLLDDVLTACRAQRGRLTGLLSQLVVRALREALPRETRYKAYIGQIVIDLRSFLPDYSDNTMGNCVSAVYETSACSGIESTYDQSFWDAVRKTTSRLSDAANKLDDQPVGLLKYLSNFRPWFLEKIGKRRDSSYEISNLGIFDPSIYGSATATATPSQEENDWKIEKIVFSQPANVTASPLNFQVVTVKDADMIITLNWQVGVLGVTDEETFTKEVLNKVKGSMEEIASA